MNDTMNNTPSPALVEALKEAEAGLEFAAARLPQTTGGFVPSHIKALGIVREALLAAQAAPAVVALQGEPVGEIVLFGGELKEVSWAGGKMPPPGTKLYPGQHAAVAVPSYVEAWSKGARFTLETATKMDSLYWLTDSMREICLVKVGNAILAERDRMLAAAPQAPDCTRCSGSGEDPEGYLTHGHGPNDHTVDGPCRSCDGTGAAPQAPAAPAEGEVLVEVSGLTGSGKSAICGEIEILCRALGLNVSWPDGDPEKDMTHADWTAALEAYRPRVRIVERNVPRQSNGGHAK